MIGALESYNRNHQPKQNPLVTKSVPVPESTTADKSRQGIEGVFPSRGWKKMKFMNCVNFAMGKKKADYLRLGRPERRYRTHSD